LAPKVRLDLRGLRVQPEQTARLDPSVHRVILAHRGQLVQLESMELTELMVPMALKESRGRKAQSVQLARPAQMESTVRTVPMVLMALTAQMARLGQQGLPVRTGQMEWTALTAQMALLARRGQ